MPALAEPDVVSRGHGVCTSYGWGPSSKTFIIRDADIRNEDPFGISHNVPHVCDAAPSLTEARGRCGDEARRSAEEPEPPRRGGDAHTSRYTKCPYEEATAAVNSFEKVSDLKDFTREWRNRSSVCGEPKLSKSTLLMTTHVKAGRPLATLNVGQRQ
jgi:hypothetical protein